MPRKKLNRGYRRRERPGKVIKTIDFPSELHDLIINIGIQERRNFSQQTIWLVEEALRARGITVPPPPPPVKKGRPFKTRPESPSPTPIAPGTV